MKTIILRLSIMLLLFCNVVGCTNNEFIKTGISNGKHPGTILEYLESDSYNWDSTLIMIHVAGLENLFDGEEKITFLGPTNHSIRRYMLENNVHRVEDLGSEFCRTTLLRHIMKGKVMREEFPRGVDNRVGEELIGTGGEIYTMMGGNKIWAYTFRGAYQDVSDVGAVTLYVTSIDGKIDIPIASTDIEPTNGVVHSLGYSFTLGEM